MYNYKSILVSSALTAVILSYSLNVSASERTYGEWSAPENLGSTVNTASRDGCQTISRDGLSLYLASDRDGGSYMDLYASERSSVDDDFGAAVRLDSISAVGADDICPTLSYDGHTLFFASTRSGGCGNRDLWVSRRHNANDNTRWGPAINLGCTVNSSTVDQGPSYYEGKNNQKYLFFSSKRATNDADFAGHNIYSMKLFDDGTPDESTLAIVRELSSLADDHRPNVSKNGKDVLFDSNRNGPTTGLDVWTASRSDTRAPFSSPSRISNVASDKNDVRAVMSADGSELYFTSNRPGGFGSIDIYRSTRNKVNDDD